MKRPNTSSHEPTLLLRVEEAARLAGIGRSTAYQLIYSGTWPSVRLGRSVRVPRRQLEEWVNRQVEGGEAA